MTAVNLYWTARKAVSANPSRPATVLLHDHDDARVVLFRFAPGQEVATHTSSSSVTLAIVSGAGYVSGADGERAVAAGEFVAYAPDEPHAMRAGTEELLLLATIAPRPGRR